MKIFIRNGEGAGLFETFVSVREAGRKRMMLMEEGG